MLLSSFLTRHFLQAHFSQSELPISDYVTDLKSVLDQSIRIIQAMIDICANSGWLSSTITCMHLLQMVMQVLLLLPKLPLSVHCKMDYYTAFITSFMYCYIGLPPMLLFFFFILGVFCSCHFLLIFGLPACPYEEYEVVFFKKKQEKSS